MNEGALDLQQRRLAMLLPSLVLQPSLTPPSPPALPHLLPLSLPLHLSMLMVHILAAAGRGEEAGSWWCVPGFEARACSSLSGGYYIFSLIIHTICRCAHACTAATLTAARVVIWCVPCCLYAVTLMLNTRSSLTFVLVSLV